MAVVGKIVEWMDGESFLWFKLDNGADFTKTQTHAQSLESAKCVLSQAASSNSLIAVQKGPRFEVAVALSPVPSWAYDTYFAVDRTAPEREAIKQLISELEGNSELHNLAKGKFAFIVNGEWRRVFFTSPADGLDKCPPDASVVILRVADGQAASNLFLALQRTGQLHKVPVEVFVLNAGGSCGALIAHGNYIVDTGADSTTVAGNIDSTSLTWTSLEPGAAVLRALPTEASTAGGTVSQGLVVGRFAVKVSNLQPVTIDSVSSTGPRTHLLLGTDVLHQLSGGWFPCQDSAGGTAAQLNLENAILPTEFSPAGQLAAAAQQVYAVAQQVYNFL